MFRDLISGPVELAGWIIAIVIVVVMGFIALHKPFNISQAKTTSAYQAGQKMPRLHVAILTDPKTIGRYEPKTIRVHIGQTVIFTNPSNAPHTVTNQAPTPAFDSGNIAINGAWTFVPTKNGTFPYICLYHPLMKGTIVVYS